MKQGAIAPEQEKQPQSCLSSRNAKRTIQSRQDSSPIQSRQYRGTAARRDDRTVLARSPAFPCPSSYQVRQSPAAAMNAIDLPAAQDPSRRQQKRRASTDVLLLSENGIVAYRESRLGAACRAAGTLPARLNSGRMPALRSMSSTAREIWRPTRDSLAISRSRDVMPLMTVE